MSSQRMTVPISDVEWHLQNHSLHHQVKAKKRRLIRDKAGWQARVELTPTTGPVSIFARAIIQKGQLPDPDAIAPMVKPIIDGIVDAGIIPDDSGKYVRLVGYMCAGKDKTIATKCHLSIVMTDQEIHF